jgi:hypothetical protein
MKSLALWLAVPFAFSSISALAADLEWSGTYRIEGVFIKDSEASSGKGTEKSYGLHHLILRPKIVASDNLTIYSQFNLFSNSAFPNSQLGQYFGNGPQGAGAANSVDDSNTLGDHEKSEELLITQLYLSMTQEYGALVAGRVPLQFGLGATHNAGNGLFDHWFDTRDLVGYKFIMGNLFFLPMVGKKHEGVLNHSDDVSSYIFHFQYDNYETNLSMGVFYEMNTANDQASQGPTGSFPGAVAGQTGKLNEKTVSIFALKETDLFRLGVEAGFQSGETGMKTAADKNITWDGFGVVGEFEYRPQGSLWKYGALAGYVSGDDPDTDGKFEGFVLDRNYDVAFLLFNHQLGQDDFFGTKGFGGGGSTTGNQQPDVEAVSNAMYLAPYARYQWSDNWAMGTKLATGWLVQNPLSGKDVKKDLGYELDLSLEYSPKKGVKWVNEVGYLFTGDAFKGGGQYDANNVMGVSTKAAISF